MLSRVADSLYWMSRYFERADNASRVLKATYGLILNPAKFSREERWFHAVSSLAPGVASNKVDPQHALFLLVADPEGSFSIVKCIKGARENARQVREEISSEMWEHLNRLFHDVTGFDLQPDDDAGAMRVVSLVHEGSYRFNGIAAATMNHDEAWHYPAGQIYRASLQSLRDARRLLRHGQACGRSGLGGPVEQLRRL